MIVTMALGAYPAAIAGEQAPAPAAIEARVLTLDPASNAAARIQLAAVSRRPITSRIDATATVEPDEAAVADITTRIPARVIQLIAQPGQAIVPGEPLAILSSLDLGRAKTDLLKSRALLSIARQNLDREQELYDKKISPLKDVLQARANYDTTLAEYRASRETLSLLVPTENPDRVAWSDTPGALSEFPLTSPIAGTVVRRNLIVGEAVDSAKILITIIDLHVVWVITNIFESDVSAIKLDDQVSVAVDAYPGRTFSGRLSYIGNEVDRNTRTVQARISVANPDLLLKPGMFARARIESFDGSRAVITVPETAVFSYQGSPIVFVAAGANRYLVRSIATGERSGDEVEVRSGLDVGDQVVAHGGLALKALLNQQDG
jgi:cobalt-zinc-cadmium efflux system membrane fusion protein